MITSRTGIVRSYFTAFRPLNRALCRKPAWPISSAPYSRVRRLTLMKRTIREVAAAAVLSLMIALPTVVSLRAQAAQKGATDLIGALKATPGVLGVDAGQMMSGKQVIFEWFENKD